MIGYYLDPKQTPNPVERLVRACQAYEARTGHAPVVAHVPPGEGGARVPGLRVVEAPRTWPLRAGCYRLGDGEEGV